MKLDLKKLVGLDLTQNRAMKNYVVNCRDDSMLKEMIEEDQQIIMPLEVKMS